MAQIRNQIQKLLAVETSSSPGSVAVGTQASDSAEAMVFLDYSLAATGNQGRDLMPTIQAATVAAGWPLAEVDLVAVAVGPGPFTGLRVGVTTAKAIAWTTGCMVVGVSTAACLAEQAVAALDHVDWPSGRVDIAFAAGRGELFVTTATPMAQDTPRCWQVSTGHLTTPVAWWKSLPKGGLITGPGLSFADEQPELPTARPDLRLAPASLWQPAATTVARLGLISAVQGWTQSPAELLPVYLRASYAEDRARTP